MFDRSPTPKTAAHSASPVSKSPTAKVVTFGPSASHDLASLSRHPPRDRAAHRPNPIGLPGRLKAGVEALSGVAMDGVRVRYRSPEPARLDALAFAKGRDIHLGPGQEQSLPHEAWHVVQQAQGRVKPTSQSGSGLSANEDPALEQEANNMARHLSYEPTKSRISTLKYTTACDTSPSAMQFDRGNRSQIRHADASDERALARYAPRAFKYADPAALPPMVEHLSELPSRYRNHPDLKRLMDTPDPQDAKIMRSKTDSTERLVSSKNTRAKRIREALAAIEFADRNDISTSQITRADGYDFDVAKHKIDPFQLPIDKKAKKTFFGTRKGGKGTYVKHTDGGKGNSKGVIGVLDTTYTSPEDVVAMDVERQSKNIGRGSRFDVRVPLIDEYHKDWQGEEIRKQLKKQSLIAHRGSDPTRKFGPTDLGKQLRKKREYDRKKALKAERASLGGSK